MGWYRWDNGDLVLDLHVQPRARLDAFVEPIGDQYRVKITAPPVDGKANTHLKRFLASSFGVPVRQIELVGGAKSRNKRFRVCDPRKLPPIIALPAS